MTGPSRNQALVAAGIGGATAAAAWLTSRRTAQQSVARRAHEPGRPLDVRGPDGNRLHTRLHGPDDAPTLVLVHCWTGTQELWHKQIAELAGELRIVAYDHRGHGLSDPGPGGDYSLEALAGDLDAVIDAALPGDGRPLLAGHSLGAMTIAAWADLSAGHVAKRARGAALISTGLDELLGDHKVAPALPGPFATLHGGISAAILEWPASIRGLPLPLARAGVAHMALGPGPRDEDIDLVTRTALDCRTQARARCGRSMARMDLLSALDELEIPTIVVAGERDLMTPITHAERIEHALPRSLGLRVEPEAGHMTPLESPELVNDALRELAAAAGNGASEPETIAA